jgi:hypothetical protein
LTFVGAIRRVALTRRPGPKIAFAVSLFRSEIVSENSFKGFQESFLLHCGIKFIQP